MWLQFILVMKFCEPAVSAAVGIKFVRLLTGPRLIFTAVQTRRPHSSQYAALNRVYRAPMKL
jgi:hypothetical protein